MNPYDLIIRHGDAILPGTGRTACDIAIRDGRIAAILAPGEPASASREIAAGGLVILPGVIDAHLHLGHGKDISRPREPLDADRETAAAAKGGVTCCIPYLLSTEPYETLFDEVIGVTEAGARIDFGYHLIISTEEQLAGIPGYVGQGTPTFKIFMNNRGGEGKRLNMPDLDDGYLLRLCEAAAQNGGMVCPHPETIELAWVLRDRVMAADPEGKGGLATWNATRPPFVEADAVQRAGYIARVAGAPVYIVHTSSEEALKAALRQRRDGSEIYIETCPQYLTHDVTAKEGVIAKVNPPLREPSDREALWQAILSGDVDTVATDHAHRDLSSKEGGIWGASPGGPGMDTLLPVLLSEGYHKRGLSLERIAALTSANPARIMGFGDRKGAIAPGLDADLAIVDLDASWTLRREDVVSSAGYSLYEGWTFKGRVLHTLVRGKAALTDGVLDDAAVGHGRFVKRKLTGRGQ
ncbi:dihydroorotase family protein [Bosea sp. (in: a-proteobacteria)]|uniref:dihydroorotase n=1 Tax=Bosea sp. (in: a-proteobacteria) TaxID=1871050 RepID=UPI0026268289|nr:dihydroorotase family protein [Bosea sp. (in: a-proteobacteria)]MCO5090590.1 dihydroorotase family protein [Bosea sp. (in: a-proteobacteria)]